MTMLIKKHFIFIFALVAFLISSTSVSAASISVSPLFIDYTTEARDVKNETIKIKNFSDVPVRLFASVNEITLGENGEILAFVAPSMVDRTVSVTSWIEISRGRIEIPPGGEKEVPFTIRINPNVAAGKYHAFVGFSNASNRDEAEAKTLSGQGDGVVVRISIDEKQSEFLRLVRFVTDRFVFKKDRQNITYEVQNTGDVALQPTGEVIFYDSRGYELSSMPINTDNKSVLPGATMEFVEPAPEFKNFGRHKAFLTLEYGVKNKAAVYDTVYFYSLPLMYLIIILSLLFVIALSLTFLIYRSTHRRHEYIDDIHDVQMYVHDGHRERDEKDHDLNLKQKNE